MYKLFATDLDDTLLSSDVTISEKNIEAIKYMYNKGLTIVIASGRITPSIKKYVELLEKHEIMVEYIISYNGALEVETKNYNIIDKRSIGADICKEIIEMARSNDIVIQVYINDLVYVEKINSYVEEYMRIDGVIVEEVDDLVKLVEENNGSYKLLLNNELEKLTKVKEKLIEMYKNDLDIFFSKDSYLELVNIETNKGLALERIAKMIGISMDEVIAVGDNQNDRAMIKLAGLGCLMANGNKELIEVADYVTENDNNHDAIAEIAYKFVK